MVSSQRFGNLSQFLLFFNSFVAAAPASSAANHHGKTNEYDYIVIGSGPGGGTMASNLALGGYSVLLLEAGDDSTYQGADVPIVGSGYPLGLTWDFFCKHYPEGDPRNLEFNHLTWMTPEGRYWVGKTDPPEGSELLGIYYPRGATLGGSSMINGLNVHLPPDKLWDSYAELLGDDSWSSKNFRSIFEKIEHNNYLSPKTPGHGFKGYFQASMPNRVGKPQPVTNPYMKALAEDIGEKLPLTDLVRRDPNVLDPRRDTQEAIYGLALHTYANGTRYSSRYLVQETAASHHPLTVSLNSLATRVLFDKPKHGKPRAVGVEYLQGKALYRGDIRHNDDDSGILRNATARREVIVSGGAFNSPQILMLSGVGPKDHLESLGIDVVVDSPGVGQNLMDNEELPIVAQGAAYINASLVLGYPLLKTNASLDGDNDIWLLQAGVPFRGFWPSNQTNENLPKDPPGTWGVGMVKGNPQNTAGYVRLRTKDPRDRPEINFNLFASDGDKVDQSAMRETMNRIRRNFVRSGAEVVEPACPSGLNADGSCSDPDVDATWLEGQTFGHHPTCTCRMGPDGDVNAVLDNKLRVRGVEGLRVVDASSFPKVPGWFPALPTFMIAQKVSEEMVKELKH
ncbi:GMC oxidoreductase [Trichoderma sp. SZMC 28012]